MPRISLFAMFLFALLLATGCGEYGKRYAGADESKVRASDVEERITDKRFDAAARKAAGCTEIEEFESEGSTHTEDPDEKIEYKHDPPHSGDHYQVPVDWGLYDTQQNDVSTVHNLEHGHIVVSFKGLSQKQEDELYEQARVNTFHLVVQPRKSNPKNGVYYTAWTAQLYCKEPSAEAMQYMIDNWRDQGPELFTDDAGGDEMGSSAK